MHVGFIHGVMNTDNMQIAGETIDFGPCAFMENFDAGTVFSSIDTRGRYAWGNQASIGQWNLTRLAEALLPVLAEDEDTAVEQAESALGLFGEAFNTKFVDGFSQKLGVPAATPSTREGAAKFISETLSVMTHQHVDFTLFFRHLTRVADGTDPSEFLGLFDDRSAGEGWLDGWREVVSEGGEVLTRRVGDMRRVNPIFIPRNHRVEEAIQGGLRGDYAVFERLCDVLARPFDEQPEHAEFERPAEPGEVVDRTFCGT
jgi:uncharacterized protein YdiU (UPF0061 family)